MPIETATGNPVTEVIRLGGETHDLMFPPDNSSLLVVDASGAVHMLHVQFSWNKKPRWLSGLGEALTGRTIGDSQRPDRLSIEETARIRENVIQELTSSAPSDPAARVILQRLEL
jgi:hypothetical protein